MVVVTVCVADTWNVLMPPATTAAAAACFSRVGDVRMWLPFVRMQKSTCKGESSRDVDGEFFCGELQMSCIAHLFFFLIFEWRKYLRGYPLLPGRIVERGTQDTIKRK
uniref:Uncharacterized protein n=1 Tax=Strigamia maritima TaxID=126957 RepID=T1JJF1_STRMM